MFLAVPLANTLVDFLSLWQPRLILRLGARGLPTPLAVAIEAVLTLAVFAARLPLGPVAFVLGLELVQNGAVAAPAALGSDGQAWRVADEVWRALWVFVTVGWPGEALSAIAGEANVPTTALLIAFLTTFTTSLWLWLALLFAPLVRFLSWTRRRGLSWLGQAVNIAQRPIAPLGYAAAGLILAVGAGVAWTEQAVADRRAGLAPQPFEIFRDCDVCPEMVALPGGRFLMGSPPDEPGREQFRDWGILEGPQTEISVAPFAIGRFEVTFREWDRCVAETSVEAAPDLDDALRCQPIPRGQDVFELEFRGQGLEFAFGDQGWGRGLRPVVTVSWHDAQAFVAWLNRRLADRGIEYRLPSEAEWEYAARAGTDGAYSFEADIDLAGCDFMNGADWAARQLNPDWNWAAACDDGYAFTAPVGSYRPNPWGLFDMHGNVWEWVEDCFHQDGYEARPVTSDATTTGCHDDESSVLRGGSWHDHPEFLRSAQRYRHRRTLRFNIIGFRVARTLVE